MPQSINSRELFKSYPTSLACPIPTLHGRPYDLYRQGKNWLETYFLNNPTFIGKAVIKSPQGEEVVVNYGKSYVVYPYGFQEVQGQYSYSELIISREDALLFNVH